MGASLSDLRKERDRLIVFTNQKKSIEDKLLQRERGLEEREAAARSFEEQLNQQSEKISVEETALLDLVNEVKRPEAEYEIQQGRFFDTDLYALLIELLFK